ncbi:putative cytosolic protein [Anaeramoeba ignava]|uniref:Cytosolic protein n=1 Tax=Anaeramoeba ignava TaxID=1746090 RepID=A0A9Q0R8B9_ANAIG|nr:putative cytosolic protein [Anaeramoeba ignava]
MEDKIDPKIKERIQSIFNKIEKEHDVTVIFAVECGSRGWGFDSPESDYDVKFVYVHNSLSWYISISSTKKDSISYESEDRLMDFEGWDIRKALNLLSNSNPSIIEWILTDYTYIDKFQFQSNCRQIILKMKSTIPLIWHYYSMALKNQKEFLISKKEINVKNYLNIIRPITHLLWFLSHDSCVYPLQYTSLLSEVPSIPEELKKSIEELIKIKKTKGKTNIEPIIIIDEWINKSLRTWEQKSQSEEATTKQSCAGSFQRLLRQKGLRDCLTFLWLFQNEEILSNVPYKLESILEGIKEIDPQILNQIKDLISQGKGEDPQDIPNLSPLHKWILSIINQYKETINQFNKDIRTQRKDRKSKEKEKSALSLNLFDDILFDIVKLIDDKKNLETKSNQDQN